MRLPTRLIDFSAYSLNNPIVPPRKYSNAIKTLLEKFINKIILLDGLTSTSYVWSDSIRDAQGLNGGLSSDFLFTGGKLYPANVNYGRKYEANALPQSSSPVWTKVSAGTISESVSGGILTFSSTQYISYEITDSTLVATKTKKVTTRFKIDSGTGWFTVTIGDGVKYVQVRFVSDGSVAYRGPSSYVTYKTGYDFSTYKVVGVELNQLGLAIFINNDQIGEIIPYANLFAYTPKTIAFGVDTIAVSLDYYYQCNDTTDATGASSGTVIWDAVACDDVPTKALVEADDYYDTGSVTYYISRDGGTTWTECQNDTLTDISSQPSGSSVVLKAVMTGDAYISAVGYGTFI